jgi:hypothetical protein
MIFPWTVFLCLYTRFPIVQTYYVEQQNKKGGTYEIMQT